MLTVGAASVLAELGVREATTERARSLAWVDAVRNGADIRAPRLPSSITPEEFLRLGIAFHEAGHAAVALACDAPVAAAKVDPSSLSGFVETWPTSDHGVGPLLGRLATLLAGVEGQSRGTGDHAAAWLSGEDDRQKAALLLEGLSDSSRASAERLAGVIVAAVLDDREVWSGVERLAFELMDSHAVDGAEVARLVSIPDSVRARIVHLVT